MCGVGNKLYELINCTELRNVISLYFCAVILVCLPSNVWSIRGKFKSCEIVMALSHLTIDPSLRGQ